MSTEVRRENGVKYFVNGSSSSINRWGRKLRRMCVENNSNIRRGGRVLGELLVNIMVDGHVQSGDI